VTEEKDKCMKNVASRQGRTRQPLVSKLETLEDNKLYKKAKSRQDVVGEIL